MAELLQEHTALIWLENVQQHWKRRDEGSCDAVCRVITSSYVIAGSDRHPNCWFTFKLLRHPSYLADKAFSDFCLLQTWKKSWKNKKDGNLLTTMIFSAPQMAGWRTKIKNSSTMAYRLWRIAEPSAFLSKRTMFKSDKISCLYSVVNCIRLRTFWTPLVGLYMTSSSVFSCCFRHSKQSTYRAFNALFGRVGRSTSADVIVQLFKMKCLPVL